MASQVIEVKCPKCNRSIRAQAVILTSTNAQFLEEKSYKCLKCNETAVVTLIEPKEDKK